jgi:hypothetical protein
MPTTCPTHLILLDLTEVKVKVMLRPTVSRPICLVIKHSFGAYDQIFITVWRLQAFWCGALSLTRGRVCPLPASQSAVVSLLSVFTIYILRVIKRVYICMYKCMYSETSLQRTRTGPKKMFAIDGCPLKREVITLVHYVKTGIWQSFVHLIFSLTVVTNEPLELRIWNRFYIYIHSYKLCMKYILQKLLYSMTASVLSNYMWYI